MSLMMNIGQSGARAFQSQVNTGAFNIANVNTTAFKRTFQDLKDLSYFNEQVPNLTFLQGVGVRSNEGFNEDFSQGALMNTGIDTHFAINGDGFFGVYNPELGQIVLTRDGTFSRNAAGDLVDSNGNLVMTRDVTDAFGNVTSVPALYRPNQMANLNRLSGGFYQIDEENLLSEMDGAVGFGEIRAGYLEASNVDLGQEMTNLIIAQRAFSMNMRVIQTGDETNQIFNNLR